MIMSQNKHACTCVNYSKYWPKKGGRAKPLKLSPDKVVSDNESLHNSIALKKLIVSIVI